MDGAVDLTSASSINLAAKQYEDNGELVKAIELYWINVNRGFIGVFPYDRLRIIYTKEKKWADALHVCELYLELDKINEKEKRKMLEWVTKYKGRLGICSIVTTSRQILQDLLNNRSIEQVKQTVTFPRNPSPKPFPSWVQDLKLVKIDVPPFETVARVHAVEEMNPNQKKYYKLLIQNWKKGAPLDVKGYTSYLFPYALSVLRNITKNPAETIYELRLLQHVYRHEQKFYTYLKDWIFDAYTYNKEYWNAIAYIQTHYHNEYKYFTSRILSLKYALNAPISGNEFLALLRHKPSQMIMENLDFITEHLEEKIREFESQNNISLLKEITEGFAQSPSVNYMFSGTGLYLASEIDYYDYSHLKDFNLVVEDWVKTAENALREIKGLPRIGEGWLNETILYNTILTIFKDSGHEIIHHSYPHFLQGQELDIHIPALNLGIEYQGRQHYEPIDFFGGQEAFERRVALDQRKKELCDVNGVHLLYFRYDEPIDEIYVKNKIQ